MGHSPRNTCFLLLGITEPVFRGAANTRDSPPQAQHVLAQQAFAEGRLQGQAGRERAHPHDRRSSENRYTSLDGQAVWGLLEGVMMSATVELQLLRHLIPS